jgi:hypothetical protein
MRPESSWPGPGVIFYFFQIAAMKAGYMLKVLNTAASRARFGELFGE